MAITFIMNRSATPPDHPLSICTAVRAQDALQDPVKTLIENCTGLFCLISDRRGEALLMPQKKMFTGRVSALVLGAFSTGTAYDVDWLTVHAGRFFPAEWNEFVDHIPPALKTSRVVDAYNDLLMDANPTIRAQAAAAWFKWENAHVATTAISRPNSRFEDSKFRLGFARQVTHCWRHNNWLSENQIIANAGRLSNIPGWLIHGRLDLSGPLDAPWKLQQVWPGSTLIIVDDEGHGGVRMAEHWVRILHDLANA